MFKPSRIVASALFLIAAITSAASADVTLKMGDSAPTFSPGKFVKGEPVKEFEKGKIYVVEFWATWCPPCRESIPHLSAMQKANPDVTFIGSDVKEDEDTVKPFVTKMGDKMDYRVALDDMTKDGGANNTAFMDAAGQNGIPTAFVIDKDSKVAWIGHPMALEPVLKQIVAGTYDIKKAAAAAAAKDKVMPFLQANDLDGALKTMKDIIAADPDQAGEIGGLEVLVLLKGKKDTVGAAKVADELATQIQDGTQLNDLAWALITTESPAAETIATAKKLSERSLEKHPDEKAFMDTLARVFAVKGDFKKAVELESKALSKVTDESEKGIYAKSLEAYKAEKIPSDN